MTDTLFDEKVPSLLKKEQMWFGSIIGRPIDDHSLMNPISPSGKPMEVEAAEHIAASPTMRPAQRIQIYNQQYWWRLLNTLHESYPFLSRLLGYYHFNNLIAIPYLQKCPPRHWSLSLLGDRLLEWCRKNYHEKDKKMVCQAAALDYAFSDCFIIGGMPHISSEDLGNEESDISIRKIFLQPYVHLFEYKYDVFKYRVDFLKQDHEYWRHHDFPLLDHSRPFYYALYRIKTNDVSWKEISRSEFMILNKFRKGASIEDICEMLEKQEKAIQAEAEKNLQYWFHEWAKREWLTLKDKKEKD